METKTYVNGHVRFSVSLFSHPEVFGFGGVSLEDVCPCDDK